MEGDGQVMCIRIHICCAVLCWSRLRRSRPTHHLVSFFFMLLSASCADASLSSRQSYKSHICPHGSKCRSKAFCPHAHILTVNISRSRSASCSLAGGTSTRGFAGDDEAGAAGGMGIRRPRSNTPEGTAAGGSTGGQRGGADADEEWQTVIRRGRRVPGPAESDGQVIIGTTLMVIRALGREL